MNIAIIGDVFLGGDLLGADLQRLVTAPAFCTADVRIANLEQAISECPPLKAKGTLHSGPLAAQQLRQLRIDAVSIANNHVSDTGPVGLLDTLVTLHDAGVASFGAGANLSDSKRKFWISENTACLAYCEPGNSYFRSVQVASSDSSGVNPLHYAEIAADLEELADNERVLLFLHFGRQHVSLPPTADLSLLRRLLEHEKVVGIVGTHSHKVQGVVRLAGKHAYPSIGNGIFPNFFIDPYQQVATIVHDPRAHIATWNYHPVFERTYKRWRKANRLSLLLVYDTDTERLRHVPVYLRTDPYELTQLQGAPRLCVMSWVALLTIIYRLPGIVYWPMERLNAALNKTLNRIAVSWWYTRQKGVWWLVRGLLQEVRNAR